MKPLNALQITLAIAWKDLQVILKDRGLLVVIIALPMVFSMLQGIVNQRFSEENQNQLFPIALVNQDEGSAGQQIEKSIDSINVLQVFKPDSVNEARQDVLDSQVLAAVIIPQDLTGNLMAYRPSQIEVIIDPTQEQFATIITSLMDEVVAPAAIQSEISYAIRTLLSENQTYQQADDHTRRAFEAQNIAVQMTQVQKMQTDPWINVTARTQAGDEVVVVPQNLFALLVPSFTVLFAFFIVGSMSSELLKEKREGSLRRLIAAPIHPWMVIAAKMLAYVCLVLIQVGLIFGVASLLFDMPLGRSPVGLLLVSAAMGLAATGMGILVAALARSDRQADSVGLLLGFVLGALGGCFIIASPIPLYKGGGTMEIISKLTPQAHALMGYDILLNEAGGAVQVLPQALVLLGFALVTFLIASKRFRFE
jgi:ABC-2 type transport system permease protein